MTKTFQERFALCFLAPEPVNVRRLQNVTAWPLGADSGQVTGLYRKLDGFAFNLMYNALAFAFVACDPQSA